MAKITSSQMELLMSAISTIFSKTEDQAKTWKTQAPVVIFASIGIIITLAAAIGYFIVTTRIAPLLILLALLMPLLCLGVYQSTANLDRVHKEFHEYNDAVGELLTLLDENEINEELIASIKTALDKAKDESGDVCEIMEQLDTTAGAEAEELTHTNFLDTLSGNQEDAVSEKEPQADIIPVEESEDSDSGRPVEDLTIHV